MCSRKETEVVNANLKLVGIICGEAGFKVPVSKSTAG